eukprot:scaffold9726_cov119-Isochrysis_galbana.AAC.33
MSHSRCQSHSAVKPCPSVRPVPKAPGPAGRGNTDGGKACSSSYASRWRLLAHAHGLTRPPPLFLTPQT